MQIWLELIISVLNLTTAMFSLWTTDCSEAHGTASCIFVEIFGCFLHCVLKFSVVFIDRCQWLELMNQMDLQFVSLSPPTCLSFEICASNASLMRIKLLEFLGHFSEEPSVHCWICSIRGIGSFGF